MSNYFQFFTKFLLYYPGTSSTHRNAFSNEELVCLPNSLASNRVLRCLNLNSSCNRDTSSGWEAFSTVLQNHSSALEKVNMLDPIQLLLMYWFHLQTH